MDSESPSPPGVKLEPAKNNRENPENLPAADRDEIDGAIDGAIHALNAAREKQAFDLLCAERDRELAEADDDLPPPFPAKIPDIECENLCRRFDGYLRGWFRNNIPCVLAAEFKRRFARRTGLSWRHIDDVFPVFQKWSTNFKFKRTRLGRSTCIVITLRHRALVLTQAETRRRLVGAIRTYAAKSGCAHIGRKFLEGFHARHGLPPEQIFYAWQTLKWIDGFVCRWRGRTTGRVLEVKTPPAAAAMTKKRQLGGRARGVLSHPEITSGISPPTGGNDLKTGAAAPPNRLPEESSGGLRPQERWAGGDRARGVAPPGLALRDTADRAGNTYGADDQSPSGRAPGGEFPAEPAENDRGSHHWRAVEKPLHVCDRWIAAPRLRAKTNFLVFVPMLRAHSACFRVAFRAPHALNFAGAALRAGFLDSEICAAYRLGLEETHAAALRDYERSEAARDRTGLALDERAGVREPSQAIARAWLRLRADVRTDEERWAAIFRGEVAPALRGEVAKLSADTRAEMRAEIRGVRARQAAREGAEPTSAPKPAREALPEIAPALSRASVRSPQTIEAHLRARGLTVAELLKLSRLEQQKFVREAIAAQRGISPKG